MPNAPLPELKAYPNGEERVHWHLEKGVKTFKHFLVLNPKDAGLLKEVLVTKRLNNWINLVLNGLQVVARF